MVSVPRGMHAQFGTQDDGHLLWCGRSTDCIPVNPKCPIDCSLDNSPRTTNALRSGYPSPAPVSCQAVLCGGASSPAAALVVTSHADQPRFPTTRAQSATDPQPWQTAPRARPRHPWPKRSHHALPPPAPVSARDMLPSRHKLWGLWAEVTDHPGDDSQCSAISVAAPRSRKQPASGCW